MALATKSSQIAKRIEDLLTANKVALGLEYIDTGEDDLVPTFPAALVGSQRMDREIKASRQYALSFTVDILVLYEKIQSASLTREDMEPVAEAVDTLITNNRQLKNAAGDAGSELVIHGFIKSIQYGISKYHEELQQAARLRYEGLSQENFA